MTLRDTAQQVLTEARDGIAWIALYKKGRSWSAEPFWSDYDEKTGTLTFDSDDLPSIHEILEADPNAVIVNGYVSNLGDSEHMTRDTLTAFLRWQYEGQYFRLADHIRQDAQAEAQPAADRYLEQVAQADSLDELDTITEAAANDDTLTGAEYEAVHAAALRKAQGWDPQNQREEPAQSEGTEAPANRPMYKTILEALEIFDSLDPASVHTITEDVSGETMTGTPAELVQRIIEQDKRTGGNISHKAETVEACAIIEAAYAIADGEAITTDDRRAVWTGCKR